MVKTSLLLKARPSPNPARQPRWSHWNSYTNKQSLGGIHTPGFLFPSYAWNTDLFDNSLKKSSHIATYDVSFYAVGECQVLAPQSLPAHVSKPSTLTIAQLLKCLSENAPNRLLLPLIISPASPRPPPSSPSSSPP
jgi:hypothetical protein